MKECKSTTTENFGTTTQENIKKRMSDKEATPGTTARSGGAGGASGYNTTGKQVLGKLDKLGSLIYKVNSKDQAEMYIRTTEAIADYVGVEYGRDMRMLVKKGKDKTFTEPGPPKLKKNETELPAGALEKFRTELNIFHREKKEYQEQKAKVFVVILGQCSQMAKSRLESDPDFDDLEDKDDVVGLLEKLHVMSFTTAGAQQPYWALQQVLKRFVAINQGPQESLGNYHKRFQALAKVVEIQWGDFYPEKLTTGNQPDDKKTAETKMLMMFFLAGVDKRRYGNLLDDFNNQYLAGKDNYPESIMMH